MKIRNCDCVKLIKEKKSYTDEGVHVGDIGVVLLDDVRCGYISVGFEGEKVNVDGIEVGLDKEVAVRVEDVEVVWTPEEGWLKK